MKISIGILLIAIALVLFTLLLPINTPWLLVTSPLFVTGFALVSSKVSKMEDDIAWLKKELKKFVKEEEK